MKKITTIIGLVTTALLPGIVGASVSFSFDYSDASNGSLWTADRKAALDRSGNTVAALFTNYNASIEIQVTSENNAGSTTLASAGSNDFVPAYTPGFSASDVVMHEILTGTDGNAGGFDGVVVVNWANAWDTSALASNVSNSAFDFESTMTHELLHAVGFLSTISQTGTDVFGSTIAGDWNPFDKYVSNSAGLLINQTTFDINQSAFTAALVGGTGPLGLSFNGPAVLAANGGNPLYLYTPTAYEDGSSGSHADDEFYGGTLIMEAATSEGPGIRGVSVLERALLRDIGYTNLVPEPSTGLLAFFGTSLLVLRRRR